MNGKGIKTCMNHRGNLGEIERTKEGETAPAGRKWRLSKEEERRWGFIAREWRERWEVTGNLPASTRAAIFTARALARACAAAPPAPGSEETLDSSVPGQPGSGCPFASRGAGPLPGPGNQSRMPRTSGAWLAHMRPTNQAPSEAKRHVRSWQCHLGRAPNGKSVCAATNHDW